MISLMLFDRIVVDANILKYLADNPTKFGSKQQMASITA